MCVLYMNVYILHVQSLDAVPNAPGPTRRWQCNTFLHVFKLSLGILFTEPVEIMKRYWILLAAPRCFFVITHVEWNAVLLVKRCQATPASNFKYQNLRISYRFLSISHVSMKSTTSNMSAKIKSFISAPITNYRVNDLSIIEIFLKKTTIFYLINHVSGVPVYSYYGIFNKWK